MKPKNLPDRMAELLLHEGNFLEELHKFLKEQDMPTLDVTEEFSDLHKVYTQSIEHLQRREDQQLSGLTTYMKEYLKTRDERLEIKRKLSVLVEKMKATEEDEDEDGE